jgi:GR25 family glycosyltransferase involved in LPS biosynthesis
VVTIIDKIYVIWHKEVFKDKLKDKLKVCFPTTEVKYIQGPNAKDPKFPQWLKDNDYSHCKNWKQGDEPNPTEWFDARGLDTFHRRDIKYGEIACGIGHLSAWRQAKKDNVNNALFLEQDAMIDESHEILIKSYMDKMTIDYDLLYAGYCKPSLEKSKAKKINS